MSSYALLMCIDTVTIVAGNFLEPPQPVFDRLKSYKSVPTARTFLWVNGAVNGHTLFSGWILPAKPRGLVLGSRVCTVCTVEPRHRAVATALLQSNSSARHSSTKKSVKLLSSAIFGLYFENYFRRGTPRLFIVP